MTGLSDASLGFCEFCGAKRIIAGQSHCASCGQKLLQFSEVALGPVPAAASAASQAAREAPEGSMKPVVQAVPAAPVAQAIPVVPSISEQPLAQPEVLPPALEPVPPPPWAATPPGNGAATPPAADRLPPPSAAAAASVPAAAPWQPPASASSGEAPQDVATASAVRRRWSRLPLVIGIVLVAVVAIAGGVYFIASSKPANLVMTVSGVELKVASAQLTDSYDSGGETIKPSLATDTFLVVKCDVITGSVKTVSWRASVTADKGAVVIPSVSEQSSQAGQLKELAWVFVVAKTSQTFVLNFPDGQTVKLDSLVTNSGPSASP